MTARDEDHEIGFSETEEAFRALVARLDYPMFVVTAGANGDRSGCLVGFCTQASIDPPRLLVLLSKANHTFKVAERAEELVVHFLGDANLELARLFGEYTSDDVDKFALCDWRPTPSGTPVVTGTMGWVAGRIKARLDAGDHVAHLLEPTAAHAEKLGTQLGFQRVRDFDPGHPA